MTEAFRPGDTVAGRFKISEELGRGAMGVVYKATDSTLERNVALKTIRFDIVADDRDARDFRERFLREARTAAKLAHPNIVTIFDVGEWEGVSYMAIELLNGVTLQELLRPRMPLPVQDCLKAAIQICRGLDEAHSHGVVHRDIKPANIMLVKNNQVKITDFGIAKVQSSATLTKEGAIVGTPSYMSPEQLSDKPVDGRADIFSTGAVLYEMLTGERAFTGENITTVILKVVTQQPEPARQRNPSLPPELDQVIERALEKDVNRRYQTIAELADDLERISGGGQPLSTATSVGTATMVPGRAPAMSFDTDLGDEASAEAEAPKKGKGLLVALVGIVLVLGAAAAVLLAMALKTRGPSPTPTPIAATTTPSPTATAPPPPTTPTPLPVPQGPSVAVVPFESKGESSLDWLRSGLADLFEADLSQSQKIKVVPREQLAEQASRLTIDLGKRLSTDAIQKLGAALSVRTILTGSFDVTGKVIRFDVYLYEADSGKILVTDYDKAEGEGKVFSGVDNLTIRLRDAMGALPDASAGDPDRDVSAVLTSQLDALKLYNAGRDALAKKDNLAALEAFKKATEKDPSFAAAHAKLSQTYALMGRGELEEQARREAEAKAKQKAEEDAKQAEALKAQEAQRLEEMRKRAEERKAEEDKEKQLAEAEARKQAEKERLAKATPGVTPSAATPAPVETTPSAPATPATAAAVKEGDLVEAPELTTQPSPIAKSDLQVSPALKKRGEQHGLIILSVLISAQGKVEEVKVLRSDIPAYNDAATDSLRKWTFSPGTKDGVKVKTWFTVSLKI